MVQQGWSFHQTRECGVFTTGDIAFRGEPVLLVIHGESEYHWQFLTCRTNKPDDSAIASLGALVEQDATLSELADLPPGWLAYRDRVGSPWVREIHCPEQLYRCAA